MAKYFLLLFFFLFIGIKGFSQTGWQKDWHLIYDKGFKVELQYYYSENSCESNGKPFKYKARLTGKYRPKPYFLNWIIQYTDCAGKLREKNNSIPIGKEGGGTVDQVLLESEDFLFIASTIEDPLFSVTTSDKPLVKEESKEGKLKSGWQDWQVIHNDGIRVELQFYHSSNSCEEEGKPFKYRTRLTGEFHKTPTYLTWSFSYKDCEGNTRFKQRYVEIGKVGGGTVNGVLQEAEENMFQASSIENTFYEVVTSYIPLKTEGIKENLNGPQSIKGIKEINPGSETELTVLGELSSTKAQWVWYKDKCGGARIGTGKSIRVRPSETTDYYVRAESESKSSNCVLAIVLVLNQVPNAANIPVTPQIQKEVTRKQPRSFDATYSKKKNKFLQLGLGGGLEWHQYAEHSKYSLSQDVGAPFAYTSTNNSMQGIGAKGEVAFHPIIKEYFSLGLITSFSVGKTPDGEKSLGNNSSYKEDYSFSRFNLGGEVALGLKPVKLLFKLNKSVLANDYAIRFKTGLVETPIFYLSQKVDKETFSAGLRLGSYSGRGSNKRGNSFDFTYNTTRNPSESNSTWDRGLGFAWWSQSAFKFQFDVVLPPTPDILSSNPKRYKNVNYQISLIYNRNWFY